MGKRKPILSDHKRVKSKLVAPFNAAFGPMREVSWINTMIPELLWIALVQEKYGPRRGVEIITAFTRDIRASDPSRQEVIWAAAGKYASISAAEIQTIVQARGKAYTEDLCTALTPLASWYPAHPLNALFRSDMPVLPPMIWHISRRSLPACLTDRRALLCSYRRQLSGSPLTQEC